MTKTINIFALAFILISLVYPIYIFTIFPKWTVDDAFITFRYAENLAKHGQLTWNAGEPPIEGYTGVALPVILSAFIKFGFDPINTSHAIGIISFFAGWLIFFAILRRLKIQNLLVGVMLLFYGTMPIFFTHALSGLETMLFIASIFASLYFFLGFLLKNSGARIFCFFLSLLLVSLVRPEGAAWAGLAILAAAFYQYKRQKQDFVKFLINLAFVYFLPALVYFLWRWNYYGALLPNTYYAKRGHGFGTGIFLEIFRFGRIYFTAPLTAGVLAILPQIDRIRMKFKQKDLDFLPANLTYMLFSSIAYMVLLVLFLTRAHLLTNFSSRFYVQFLPFLWLWLAILLHVGIFELNASREEKPLAYQLIICFFIALSAYQMLFQIIKIKDEISFSIVEKTEKENMHYIAGKFLGQNISPNEWLAVYLDAGAAPYFSKLKTVDFGALNDPLLARGNLSPKERIDYFYAKNPAALFFTSTSLDKVEYTEESTAITKDQRFANYILAKKYPSQFNYLPSYHELLYLRKDIYAKLKH